MQTLLSARQVQEVLHIDRSTVYRMAEDGRLPAIRVGKQWRFPADEIYRVVDTAPPVLNTSPLDPKVAAAIADLAGDLLGVMVIVTGCSRSADRRPGTERSSVRSCRSR